MSDSFEDAKKIKIFDELFVWLGKDKITLKDLTGDQLEHFTILFGKSGELDIHKTREGTIKEYESLAKVNLEEIIKNLLVTGFSEEKFTEELISDLIKVDFTEEEFADHKIIDMINRDLLLNHMIKKKKEVRMTPESVKDISIDDLLIPWNKGKEKAIERAMVTKDGEPVGMLFRKNDEHFYLTLDSFLKSTFGQAIQDQLPKNKGQLSDDS